MQVTYIDELKNADDIYSLYDNLGWNKHVRLDKEKLVEAMDKSYFAVYVYDKDDLVATGRVISDGITNAYICGLGVDTEYRNRGIGRKIIELITEKCERENLRIQFFCDESLESYYEKMGFETFAIGMKKNC